MCRIPAYYFQQEAFVSFVSPHISVFCLQDGVISRPADTAVDVPNILDLYWHISRLTLSSSNIAGRISLFEAQFLAVFRLHPF